MRRKTIEDYVELIYVIEIEKDIVHTNDIAESLKINPASVTEIFQKLNNEGYIDYKKYSGVKLTRKGKKLALNIIEKHETLKNFLIILGIEENIANEDACKIEHILNPKTMNRLTKFVEFVQNFKGEPRWLERFDHYYRTGEHFKCDCPISEI